MVVNSTMRRFFCVFDLYLIYTYTVHNSIGLVQVHVLYTVQYSRVLNMAFLHDFQIFCISFCFVLAGLDPGVATFLAFVLTRIFLKIVL